MLLLIAQSHIVLNHPKKYQKRDKEKKVESFKNFNNPRDISCYKESMKENFYLIHISFRKNIFF